MWYYALNDQQHGPVDVFTLERLLTQHTITPQTLIWRAGMDNWLSYESSELVMPSPPAAGDVGALETCAYSGRQAPVADMVQIDGFWILASEKDAAVDYLQQGGRLPKVLPDAAFQGNLDPGYLMNLSWRTLMGCLKPSIALYLLVFIPVNAVGMYLLYPITANRGAPLPPGQLFSILSMAMVPLLLVGPLATGGLLFILGRQLRGETTSLGEAFGGGMANWARLIATSLVLMLLGGMGALLFIFPAVIIVIRTSLASVAAVDGKMDSFSAVGSSWEVTKGQYWRTFITFVGLTLVCGMPAGMIMSVVRLFLPGAEWVIPLSAVDTVLRLPTLYMISYLLCYYKELRALRPRA